VRLPNDRDEAIGSMPGDTFENSIGNSAAGEQLTAFHRIGPHKAPHVFDKNAQNGRAWYSLV
jgi:hypothetical protein